MIFYKKYLNKIVFLKGRILNLKIHKYYLFFDLLTNFGIFQIFSKNLFFFKFLKNNFFVKILGIISFRNFLNFNYFLNNGIIEIFILKIFFLNFLFFLSFNHFNISLKKFFLNNLKFKNFILYISNLFFFFERFYYIETPILNKFFPEGSKSFLVPCNFLFYTLTQSPQIFKQLLIIFGFSKYYQFSKCFRNENLRSDRSLEFIQLDFEFSLLNNFDVLFFIKNFFFYLIFKIFNNYLFFNFSIILYKNSLKNFLTDKPDLRFKNKFFIFFFFNFYLFFLNKSFYLINFFNFFYLIGKNFKNYLFYLKNFYFFFYFFKNFYFLNLFFIKFLNIFLFEIFSLLKIKKNFFCNIFFSLSNHLNNFFLFNKNFFFKFFFINNFLNYEFLFAFILNFPLFKYNSFLKKYEFATNPFSKPLILDIIFLDTNPLHCYSKTYDLIINNIEIGSGSIRNEKYFLQKKIFLIFSNIFEISYNFGFFLNFLKKSAPTHAGAAFGLDRLLMIFLGLKSIKNLSIFDKNFNINNKFFKIPNFIF